MTVLDRKLITRMVNPQPGGNGGGSGAGGAGAYVLPAASNSELGGIKLGYPTGTGKFYPVQLDDQQRAYVNVPWTDHYAWGDITGKPSFATVATSGSYNDLSNKPSIPSVSGSVSGSTLTITINGSSYSLTDTNTWRPVEDNLSSTSATNSLSANQGRVLNNKFASYLPLAGGSMNSGARISFNGGNGYIGNADNAGWLMVQDICSQAGAGDTYWAIRTNGQAVFTKMTSKTSSKALSDARHKEVKRDVELTVEQIAAMPAVIFEWLDKDLKDIDPGEHVGTLAQEWQKILPQAVSEQEDGTLTMGYGEAALVSVITLARRVLKLVRSMFKLTRHVLKLERRVLKLEKEIAKLKEQKECH